MADRPYVPRGYQPVLPLDLLMLKQLPKVGTLFMGVYPEAASIRDIQKGITEAELPTAMLSTRLRILHHYGLVVPVSIPRSPTMGWQITPEGEAFVASQTREEVSDGG